MHSEWIYLNYDVREVRMAAYEKLRTGVMNVPMVLVVTTRCATSDDSVVTIR